MAARTAATRRASSGSEIARIWAASRPALRPPSIATVATGTPRGIWTIDSSESIPSSAELRTGTPITGSVVTAASIPGRCAAPPAPAGPCRCPGRPRPPAGRTPSEPPRRGRAPGPGEGLLAGGAEDGDVAHLAARPHLGLVVEVQVSARLGQRAGDVGGGRPRARA